MEHEQSVVSDKKSVSIVLPVFNEEESLLILNNKIVEVMKAEDRPFEIIYVDDGSSDVSANVIRACVGKSDTVKGVILRHNFGQTAAIAAGIDYANGEIIIIMASDLQNDPADIPRLLQSMDNGADIVSGWRKDRKDTLARTFPSWVANKLIKNMSGLEIHDLGCSLKAYRREIIKEVKLYGETHRFIAIYAYMIGGRVEEVVVQHHPRQFGKTSYRLNQVIKVLLDLITLKYMLSYATKPIYFFGKLSFFVLFLGLLAFGSLLIHKYGYGVSFNRSPFMLLSSMFFLVSFQTLITGILAEILMRIYHESQKKPVYYVKELVNGNRPEEASDQES